jgi:hypothetical protein
VKGKRICTVQHPTVSYLAVPPTNLERQNVDQHPVVFQRPFHQAVVHLRKETSYQGSKSQSITLFVTLRDDTMIQKEKQFKSKCTQEDVCLSTMLPVLFMWNIKSL